MNYGFLGAGNMASAIIQGMIQKQFASPESIAIYDNNPFVVETCRERFNTAVCDELSSLVKHSDVIILAVKPVNFLELLPQLEPLIIPDHHLLVSIAAGQNIESIEPMLGVPVPIIRIMPNINAQIGASVTAMCGNTLTTPQQKKLIRQLFEAIGSVVEIPEKHFPVFSAIASCSPAYAYLFIDSLAKGALKAGMNKKQAIDIAARAVMGSAQMVLESSDHPLELMDKVCSPGGTAIEGLYTLWEHQFEQGIVNAVNASIQKDRSMNG